MWDRIEIVAYFVGGLVLLCGMAPLFAIFGGMNREHEHENPAVPMWPPDRPRSVTTLRTAARVVAVRGVPARNARLVDRIERRRNEGYPFLCGTPSDAVGEIGESPETERATVWTE